MSDESTTRPPEDEGATSLGSPVAAEAPQEPGIDAPEPVDVEPPIMPEPEPVLEQPAGTEFEPPPPPPPPAGPLPRPEGYPPPPPPAPGQYPPPGYQAQQPPTGYAPKSRIVAGVLGILLGGFGVHKFYLGYNTEGLMMVALWALGWVTLGVVSSAVWIVGFIEGIIYLTKTDDEFQTTYVSGRRPWF